MSKPEQKGKTQNKPPAPGAFSGGLVSRLRSQGLVEFIRVHTHYDRFTRANTYSNAVR